MRNRAFQSNHRQAIGRGGQNVKLASELTGWTLNVISAQEAQTKNEQEKSNDYDNFNYGRNDCKHRSFILCKHPQISANPVPF